MHRFNPTLIVLLIVISGSLSGQTVNVKVQQQPSFQQSFNQAFQNGMAARTAAAASASANAAAAAAAEAALKDNSTEILVDRLKNNTNLYKAVVIRNVDGWQPEGNTETIFETLLSGNRFKIFNNTGIMKGKVLKKSFSFQPNDIPNPNEVLYLDFFREAQSQYTRISKIVLSNQKGEVIYEAIHKNIPYTEMFMPLTSSYRFSKDEALLKVKEMRELLDLGVISQEEYNALVLELKPILTGNK